MRIAKVALAFFSIGFLAGSFERAAGLGDPQRPKRIAERNGEATVARATRLVLASVGPVQLDLDALIRASARTSVDPALEMAAAALNWSAPEPEAKGGAAGPPPASLSPLNPDQQVRRLTGRRMLSEPDRLAFSMSRLPPPMSVAAPDDWAGSRRMDDVEVRARAGGGASQEFIMPFERGRVTSLFNQGRYHPAIDLAGPLGATVHSTTRKQRVTFAGWQRGYGNVVVTRDDRGRTHLYGHLLKIVAKVGSVLDQGQKLGALGSTGRSTGPHVHYEVRAGLGHINPVTLLFPGRRVGRGFAWNGSRSIRPGATTVAQAQPRPR